MKNKQKYKRISVFLNVLLVLCAGVTVYALLASDTGVYGRYRAEGAAVQSARVASWKPEVTFSSDGSRELTTDGESWTEAYTLTVKNSSEVAASCTVKFSNVPAYTTVRLEEEEKQAAGDGTVSFSEVADFKPGDAVEKEFHVYFKRLYKASPSEAVDIRVTVEMTQID